MKDDLINFLGRLNELMKEKDLTVLGISRIIHCDRRAITRWLEGKFFPRHNNLIALADYFDCSVDFILGLADKEEFNSSKSKSTFKERFKECLTKNNLSEYRIAKLCNIEQSTISKWLIHGRMPETDTLIALSKIFDCSVEYLLGRADS